MGMERMADTVFRASHRHAVMHSPGIFHRLRTSPRRFRQVLASVYRTSPELLNLVITRWYILAEALHCQPPELSIEPIKPGERRSQIDRATDGHISHGIHHVPVHRLLLPETL
jgi:hypothetical protein